MTVNIARAAAEARALRLALALAARVGWTLDRTGPALSTPFAGYLHIASAQLLLVPTVAGLDYARRQVDPATRACRSDAIIVSLTGNTLPGFALATWSRTCTGWTMPLALWLAPGGESWLVPPPGSFDRLAVRLVDRLHTVGGLPWDDFSNRFDGFDRAAAWLEALEGEERLPEVEKK